MAIATLSIDLVAKLAKLEEGMDKASRLAAKHANRIEREFAKLKFVGATVGAAIGGAFAGVGVAGMVMLAQSVVSGIDALNDLKDASGASIENISALEDIAARTGTQFATVGKALIKFNQVLADAKPGSEYEGMLKAIGLNLEEIKRLDPAEALRQTAVALARFEDDGSKARLMTELFGRSVGEIAPLLADLAEQTKLVATVTTEEAKAAEELNKQISQLQKSVVDVARDIAGPMLTALNKTIEKFKLGAAEGKSFYTVIREEQLKLLGLRGAAVGMQSQSGVVTDLMDRDALRRFEIAGMGRASIVIPDKPDKPDKTKAAKPGIAAEFDQLDAFRRSELEATEAVNQALADSKLVDWAKARTDALKLTTDAQERLNTLIAATPTAQLEKQRDDMQFLAAAFERGAITAEQFGEAANASLGNVAPEVKKALDAMDEFEKQAQRNVQDSLAGTLKSAFKGEFDGILDMWADTLLEMASQAAATQLNQYLFGDGSKGSTGVLGAFFSSLFHTGGVVGEGGTVRAVSPLAFAGAKRYHAGGLAGDEVPLIARRGEEILTATDPRHRSNRGMSGGVVNITQNIGAGVTRNEVMSLLQVYGAQLKGEILGSMRNGGAFAQ